MAVYLVMLLVVPIIIGIAGLIWSRGHITFKEFAVLEGAAALVIIIGYAIAKHSSTADREIWSGRIVAKEKVRTSCSHSYQCNPYPCGEDGESTCYQTCYEHSNDWDWDLFTSNGETITIDRIDRRGSQEPPRWTEAYINEPTAQSHSFTNYIKANPYTVLRRRDATQNFANILPEYPGDVYDYYHVDRLVFAGAIVPDAPAWDFMLSEINADLGAKKKVNIIVVVAGTADPAFEFALEEAWIGGKKNDLIVVIGTSSYPQIDWVRIVSWSEAEDLKVALRDKIMALGSLKKRPEIGYVIRTETDEKFVHKSMDEFKYLLAGMQPGTKTTVFLFFLGTAISVGLSILFWKEDPFSDRIYSFSPPTLKTERRHR